MTIDFFSPRFVTETDEPSPWTDCTFCAGLMFANKAGKGKYPYDRPEREALRKASGDTVGGASLYDLRRGIERRYGWTFPLTVITWQTFLARMARGDGAVGQGLYSKLSYAHQRWDRNFAAKGSKSTHAMYFQGHDRGDNQHLDAKGLPLDLFVCDPLGRGTTYRGEWFSRDECKRFFDGLSYFGVATVMQGVAA